MEIDEDKTMIASFQKLKEAWNKLLSAVAQDISERSVGYLIFIIVYILIEIFFAEGGVK